MSSYIEEFFKLIEKIPLTVSNFFGNLVQTGGESQQERWQTEQYEIFYSMETIAVILSILFILMVIYSLYLTFTCDTNIISMFFDTILSIIFPAISIAMSYVSGCKNEILWTPLIKSLGIHFTNFIVFIATIIVTLIPIIAPAISMMGAFALI